MGIGTAICLIRIPIRMLSRAGRYGLKGTAVAARLPFLRTKPTKASLLAFVYLSCALYIAHELIHLAHN